MKIGVLGAGLMGKEAARDLSKSDNVTFVGLADVNFERAKQAVYEIGSNKVQAFQVGAENDDELATYMKQFDCIINALFYSFNLKVAKTAIQVGVHSVDLGGHIGHITDRVLELNQEADASQVTIKIGRASCRERV